MEENQEDELSEEYLNQHISTVNKILKRCNGNAQLADLVLKSMIADSLEDIKDSMESEDEDDDEEEDEPEQPAQPSQQPLPQ